MLYALPVLGIGNTGGQTSASFQFFSVRSLGSKARSVMNLAEFPPEPDNKAGQCYTTASLEQTAVNNEFQNLAVGGLEGDRTM